MPSVAPWPATTAARGVEVRCCVGTPCRAGAACEAARADAVLRALARSAVTDPARCARAGPASDAGPADGASGASADAVAEPLKSTAAPIPAPTPSATANPPTRPTHNPARTSTLSPSLGSPGAARLAEDNPLAPPRSANASEWSSWRIRPVREAEARIVANTPADGGSTRPLPGRC